MAMISGKIERLVVLLDEGESAYEAALLMSEKGIGSVVVTRASQVIGLFTERDLMRLVVVKHRDPAAVRIKDAMRTDIVRVAPREEVAHCMELMKQNQCRHLLVFDGDAFVGIISLRDLLLLLVEEKEELIRQLTRYVAS
ncbi:MAG: CBS domain-containing protein [Nitrococcus sp.]|nr:CBS domain-containing protein [Nitrococcus sp.]